MKIRSQQTIQYLGKRPIATFGRYLAAKPKGKRYTRAFWNQVKEVCTANPQLIQTMVLWRKHYENRCFLMRQAPFVDAPTRAGNPDFGWAIDRLGYFINLVGFELFEALKDRWKSEFFPLCILFFTQSSHRVHWMRTEVLPYFNPGDFESSNTAYKKLHQKLHEVQMSDLNSSPFWRNPSYKPVGNHHF